MLALFHQPLLTFLGNQLVYQSELHPVDVITVLGGGENRRVEEAVELYQQGYADTLLLCVPLEVDEDVPYRDLYTIEGRICQAVLDHHGIPAEPIHWATQTFYSTYAEAQFIQNWMRQHHAQSNIIVTGWFQSRRAKWTMEHVFSEKRQNELLYAPAPVKIFSSTQWWKHEEGMISVQNEYLKQTYYLFKYTLGQFD